ncbi:hypothetical protein M8J76_016707 [Diaphorina citri]|nr:hypothetical protein M8J75_001875 [Diaphorina citri]KAI5717048.1 hypothetical protein M8J76_016707 [Diaphorina citri]
MPDLEDTLMKELECEVVKPFGARSGSFRTFDIDKYGKVFVKICSDKKIARPMFEAEMVGGACLVIDYLFTENMFSEERQRDLGKALAHLHLHNARMKTKQPEKYVSKFGFNMSTYCGRIPQDNSWKDNWVDFIMNNRLKYQIDLLREKMLSEEACGLWDFKLKPNIPKLFENITIEPALLHGDFWSGNAGQKVDGTEAQIYDPAVFYGHHEYDLAITYLFGGFVDEFYEAYHSIIPKAPGFENRIRVYQLFHYLNHWNHFGVSYKSSTLSCMKSILNVLNQYGRAYYYLTVNLMRDICLSLNLRGVNYRRFEDDYSDYNRLKPNEEKPITKRTKHPNKAALFNTTRNRGRKANVSKTTTPRPLSTRSKTTYVKTSKIYLDSDNETEEPYNGTTLSFGQIYEYFYRQEGFDWMRRKRRKRAVDRLARLLELRKKYGASKRAD